MKNFNVLLIAIAFAHSTVVWADEVILDDLIVGFSLCVGDQCADGEVFDMDSLKLKTDDPRIHFDSVD